LRVGNLIRTMTTNARSLTGIMPGDIVQMRNVEFYHRSSNGSWYQNNYPHHTAVVKAVAADGGELCVLQQNVNNEKYVQVGTMALSDLTEGTIKSFAPK